jgi:electron transfer flavoprotein-quinone oxidoreductase
MDKFDAIVVGAGPAGVTAALTLAQAGLNVAVFERGEQPGSKNMFGGVLYYTLTLEELIPGFWEKAPIERYVTRHDITFVTEGSSFSVAYKDREFGNPPYNGVTLLRARFDPWYAARAEEAGARLISETVVDGLIRDGERVVGIRARRDEGEVYADAVIVADGANSLLARQAALRKDFNAPAMSVAAKEVLALPAETIEARFDLANSEGVAKSFIGSITQGMEGGGFIYTNKASLSLGVVVRLSSLAERRVSIADVLEEFKGHPDIERSIEGATLKEYSGHLIPEAGLEMVPELCDNGLLVAGDAAGFLVSTGLTLQGMNFAIASGYFAARTVLAAGEKGDFSKQSLASYKTRLEESFVLKDMRTFRHTPALLANPRLYELYPRLVCGTARRVFQMSGQPQQKICHLLRAEMKSKKLSLFQFIKDIIQAGRALLWP